MLLSIAHNKVAHAARRQFTQKRGGGRNAPEPVENFAVVGQTASVGRVVAGRELLEQVRARLNDEERKVADLRGQGHDWAGIAQQLGGTPDGRRMQLTRALDRVGRELGLEDGDE